MQQYSSRFQQNFNAKNGNPTCIFVLCWCNIASMSQSWNRTLEEITHSGSILYLLKSSYNILALSQIVKHLIYNVICNQNLLLSLYCTSSHYYFIIITSYIPCFRTSLCSSVRTSGSSPDLKNKVFPIPSSNVLTEKVTVLVIFLSLFYSA